MKTNNTNQPIKSPEPINQPQPNTNPTPFYKQKSIVPIILGVVVLILVVGVVAYFIGMKNTGQTKQTTANTGNTQLPTTTNAPSSEAVSTNPKFVTFMRDGQIWTKDLATNQEKKVSKTHPVHNPKLSYDGKYVSYFRLIHGAGGFPVSDFYVTDTQSGNETTVGVGNPASRLTWAKDNNLVGFISFFTNEKPTYAILYDPELGKNIVEKELTVFRENKYGDSLITIDESYDVSLSCATLDQKYISFCNEYEAVLNQDLKSREITYKQEEFRNSKYTKPNYNLMTSQKLSNGLVILEYYTGEPQNPESQWGIAGGVFIPGYDKGVTETYTLLLNENEDRIIVEIPRAVDSNFVF